MLVGLQLDTRWICTGPSLMFVGLSLDDPVGFRCERPQCYQRFVIFMHFHWTLLDGPFGFRCEGRECYPLFLFVVDFRWTFISMIHLEFSFRRAGRGGGPSYWARTFRRAGGGKGPISGSRTSRTSRTSLKKIRVTPPPFTACCPPLSLFAYPTSLATINFISM